MECQAVEMIFKGLIEAAREPLLVGQHVTLPIRVCFLGGLGFLRVRARQI